MKKRLLLHIGTGKTGTTSIQKSLFKVRCKLMERFDMLYPDVMGQWDHQTFAAAHAQNRFRAMDVRIAYSGLEDNDYFGQYLSSLKRMLASAQSSILSAEYLSVLTKQDVARIKEFLEYFSFDDILTVVYFRQPQNYYVSFIQQQIKSSPNFTAPNRFLYPIRSIIENWGAFFPNLNIRLFDRSSLNSGDVVDDFFSVAQSFFELNEELPRIPSNPANTGFSLESLLFLRDFWMREGSSSDRATAEKRRKVIKALRLAEVECHCTPLKLKVKIENLVAERHKSEVEYFNAHSVHKMHKYEGDIASDELAECPNFELSDVFNDFDSQSCSEFSNHVLNLLKGNG